MLERVSHDTMLERYSHDKATDSAGAVVKAA